MTAEDLKTLLISGAPQFASQSVSGDTKFASILDSIDMLEFECYVQDKFDITLPDDFFDDTETVDQLVAKLLLFLHSKEVIDDGMREKGQIREEKEINSQGEAT